MNENYNKKMTLLTKMSLSVYLLMVGFILYVAFLMFYPPYKVVKFSYNKIPVVNKKVYQGEVLPLHLVFEKFVDGPSLITTRFINGGVFSMPDFTVYRKAGKYDFIGYDLVVPIHLPPGRYYIQRTYSTDVNWLRKDHIEMQTEDFEILETSPHNDATDERLIKRVLKELKIINGEKEQGKKK